MKKINRIIEDIKHLHYRHDKAAKIKHIFNFSNGSKIMLYRVPAPLDQQMLITEQEMPPEKISESDLLKLHDMISKNDKNKVKFRDSLYEKYGISNITYRIVVRDGAIERIK